MATEPPVYDLVLLLDTQVDEERRIQILDNVQTAIEKSGEVVGRHDWGVRPTVYEIHKRPDADYHLFQFRGGVELLEQLNHTLKITDGVLRFRISKLRAGTPPPPEMGAATAATLQTVVPRHVLDSVADVGPLAILGLASLAVVMAICSEADAFVAAGLTQF